MRLQTKLEPGQSWEDVIKSEIEIACNYEIKGIKLPPHAAINLVRRAYEGGGSFGDFLSAVMNNDLAKAVEHGDHAHVAAIRTIMMWIWNVPPGDLRHKDYIGIIQRVKEWEKEQNGKV